MKISKLFHWLYAILMLLPFAFFVPSVLYYAFNDNSTMQNVEVPKAETISVDFNQQILDLDNVTTTFKGVSCTIDNSITTLDGTLTEDNLWFNRSGYLTNVYYVNHKYLVKAYFENNTNNSWHYVFGGNGSCFGYTEISTTQDLILTCNFTPTQNSNKPHYILRTYATSGTTFNEVRTSFSLYDLTQMFGEGNEPTVEEFNNLFPNVYYPYTESKLKQITYDTGETEQIVSNTDIINYAWESIWDLPLFNWCKVSFVSVPFTYITGLFGLAASNSFNYVFTYFASMSIIWLVYDVIMYVPLLVHRWLDKGIVE